MAGEIRKFYNVPMWAIKLVAMLLSVVVMVCVLMQTKAVWQANLATLITLVLTSGLLFGWAMASVLNNFFAFIRTDFVAYLILAAMSIASVVLCGMYLMNNNNSRSYEYRILTGITICVGIEALTCLTLMFWACFSNYSIETTG